MLLFCEKAIRGGLNGVGALRHFRANNKDLNGYNKDQKSVYGAFLDVTSLYGGIMMKKLPKDGYQWAEFADIDSLIETYKNKDSVGYFVGVDLNYPASFTTIILIFHWLLRNFLLATTGCHPIVSS